MASLVLDYSLTTKDISNDFIFLDLNLDIDYDDNNRDIRVSKDIDAVQNSINNMFLFIPGERVLMPQFGNSLYQYLYEPINELTAKRIGNELKTAFEKYEPRVKLTAINITPDEDNNTYYIEVVYIIPSIDREKSLSFSKAVNMRR